ncbi:hypothetical protein NHF48_007275 [Sphingomonas sp. H160509]|uniref:hypothetical protein n=1 Tax=Sphingomonas sp. H160509 TaxID=2955313 RepID=UPI002097003A|nr:hypothetical protein [Sphingomonas sp. H160509]MDD1450802.1 hypothetical protein [Sphingomonas sp. H160509]
MTDYKLIDSAIAPAGQNLPKVFTDGSTFFSLDGTTRKVKGAFGRRLYLLSTVRAVDDFGWSLSRAVVDALVDTDVAAQAVQITSPAQIVGGNEVGQTVMCIDGRVTGFPSPYNLYQWKRNGADIPGAFREVYTRQAADIGTALTCEQRWFNSCISSGRSNGSDRSAYDCARYGADRRHSSSRRQRCPWHR